MMTRAAAPSFSGQAFPAVTRPSGRNAGFSAARPSSVVPGRGESSVLITVPSGKVTGVISRCPEAFGGCLFGQILAADGELVHLLRG